MSDHAGHDGGEGSPMNTDDTDGMINSSATTMAKLHIEPTGEIVAWWGRDLDWLVFDEPEECFADPAAKVREYHYLHRLGHYAGRLWKYILKAASTKYPIGPRVVAFRDKINEELKVSWESGNFSPGGCTSVKALIESVRFLQEHQNLDVDLDMAKLAILVYSKRNLLCHAKVGNPSIQSDPRRLTGAVDAEINSLQQILPESQARHYYTTWQRLVRLYANPRSEKIHRQDDRAEAHHQSANASQDLDLRLLPPLTRGRAFKERIFDSRVQATSRTPEDRMPHTPYRQRMRSSVSDTTSYLNRKRSASGSPDPDGGTDVMDDKRTARSRHTSFAAFVDARIEGKVQTLLQEIKDLVDSNVGQGERALDKALAEVRNQRKKGESAEGKKGSKASKKARRAARSSEEKTGE